jgi:hypothetical protein
MEVLVGLICGLEGLWIIELEFEWNLWFHDFRGGMDALPDSVRATPRKPKEPVPQHNVMDGCQKSQNESVRGKQKTKKLERELLCHFPNCSN